MVNNTVHDLFDDKFAQWKGSKMLIEELESKQTDEHIGMILDLFYLNFFYTYNSICRSFNPKVQSMLVFLKKYIC